MTPLLLIAALSLGALALVSIPREEEPQISVPMVDILVSADGLKAVDVVELVTEPLEEIVEGIDGVEHVYSQSVDDGAVVTARFEVGTDEDAAILRVHSEVRANYDRIPIGIPEPLIAGRGINDVAIVVLTLTPKPEAADRWTPNGLQNLAEELRWELAKTEDVGLTYLVGGEPDEIRVEPDPERLALFGVTLNRLVEKIENANRSFALGNLIEGGQRLPAVAGQTLQGFPDIGQLLITTQDGRPVYVNDVARIVVGSKFTEARVWHASKEEAQKGDARPAVSLAIAKRKGANAVTVATAVLERLDGVRDTLIPDSVEIHLVRDYGETANDKSNELLSHLFGATVTIVLIIALAIGWREGAVVAIVIPATILLTFFASWVMGYTVNRVSLFALIFSIGILVDDAIVMIENIVRRWRREPGRNPVDVAVEAVSEVGNPTIVATLTIIAALLPMLFVSGLMGPYMSPIPINASAAMVFSFFVAVTIAPWLLLRLRGIGRRREKGHAGEGALELGYRRIASWLLEGRRRSQWFLGIVALATILSCLLFATRSVTVKLLPFDDKSELQLVVDLPEGASLEETERVLFAAAKQAAGVAEVESVEAYAGTAAPFNFNGLVRHYYIRRSQELGDLQINLADKADRGRASHAIALDIRESLKGLDMPSGTVVKVVEVPPGPPVLATLLAEIYGPDAETRRAVADEVRKAFESVDFVVDTDTSFGEKTSRIRYAIDQEALEYFGVEEEAVFDTLSALLRGAPVGYSQRGGGADPVEIAIRLPRERRIPGERLLATPVPARDGLVELGDVVQTIHEETSYPIFRHNGRFAEMVTGDLAGRFEAPIYGMFAVEDALDALPEEAWERTARPEIAYHGQPRDETKPTLLWDGEWEVTYVTFRDMGAAFAVAILGIYLLLVAQFSSFRLPLVILVPVPLTLIGIVFGHWLLSAAFTATSMIGFIALAGIIVRNSILLVDFIVARKAAGAPLREALLAAGATRFKPIALTAVTAMVGAAFILTDPIFQGLAVSLLFGLLSSTALTVLTIPAIYVWLRDDVAQA